MYILRHIIRISSIRYSFCQISFDENNSYHVFTQVTELLSQDENFFHGISKNPEVIINSDRALRGLRTIHVTKTFNIFAGRRIN